MFFFGFLLFTLLILIPLGLSFWRRATIQRQTQDPAADFYRDQLKSLQKDHQARLIDDTHYEAARLEAQRHLLDSTAAPPEAGLSGRRAHFLITISSLLLIPILALLLYSVNGLPFLSSQSADTRGPTPSLAQSSTTLLEDLNTKLAHLSPQDPHYAALHLKRGQLEAEMGLTDQTILDWKAALDVSFTAELALNIAELETRNAGHVTADALSLYHRALATAPPNAPWRLAVEARIAAGEHEKDQTEP
ncbi:c-type cytochrome biogenesis protein CcmI [Saccharibacter sp. 17.LH.SD]|uniref:c-type cytochrome biogenesis protein CcmI n=1 Tax=Saccharibacter sp. 17.LH.SD TaxID=2689393 RepID=UPI0013680170|nr:c-type cytochrome biogenesis protein CcmI [Saccharibacter sp. 17.LH.SD]MXV43948.1 c-type cytochrome biogenesis protein CcmI [Saccharibacter sp. 17.LH.SD]